MNKQTFDPEQFASLGEDLRLLLAAGLSRLAEDLTDQNPLLDRVQRLRSTLEKGTILSRVPAHASLDEPGLQEMLSYLGDSEYWAIYWEYGDDDTYDLVGEIAVAGDISHFSLVNGLDGTAPFVLAEEDAAFVEKLREYVRMWAPSTSDEMSVAVVEVPVSWTALDGMMQDGELLESYLGYITSSSEVSGIMTRGARGDTHSNPDLEQAEYVGLTTLAIDTRRKLATLPKIIAAYEASLTASVRKQPG
ncbi:hypothetical protein D3C71_315890 [compost metagenome]